MVQIHFLAYMYTSVSLVYHMYRTFRSVELAGRLDDTICYLLYCELITCGGDMTGCCMQPEDI